MCKVYLWNRGEQKGEELAMKQEVLLATDFNVCRGLEDVTCAALGGPRLSFCLCAVYLSTAGLGILSS
jgi:hypothetical protein